MRTVEFVWRPEVRSSVGFEPRNRRAELSFFLKARYWFRPFYAVLLVEAALMIGALFRIELAALFFSSLCFWVYQFIRVRETAYRIQVQRSLSQKRPHQGENIEFRYVIKNYSSYEIDDLRIRESLTCTRAGQVEANAMRAIRPFSIMQLKAQVLCDSGLGRYELGPIEIEISDFIRVLRFRVQIEIADFIDIKPHLNPPCAGGLARNAALLSLGVVPTPKSGGQFNYSGVRPYVFGDPLKSIAWKLSFRGGGLVTKEFESTSQVDTEIIVNLLPSAHHRSLSADSLEFTKNLLLSLCAIENQSQGIYRVITPFFISEKGSGHDHIAGILAQIEGLSWHTAWSLEAGRSAARFDWFDAQRALLAAAGNVFILTPIYQKLEWDLVAGALALQKSGAHVYLFGIRNERIIKEVNQSSLIAPRWSVVNPTTGEWEELLRQLKVAGSRVVDLDSTDSVRSTHLKLSQLEQELAQIG